MRRGTRALILSVFAYWTVTTWPVPLARAALGVAYRSRTYGVGEAADAVGSFAAVGAALVVAVLCRSGVSDPRRFWRAGAFGGALVGGGALTLTELIQRQDTCATVACRLWLVTTGVPAGALWSLFIAVPAGALVGTIIWSMAKLIGAVDTPWWPGHPGRRAGAIVAIMAVQGVLGFWLRRTLGT